jgi:hypothetical protein
MGGAIFQTSRNQNDLIFLRLQVCCIPLDLTSLKRYQLVLANAKLIEDLRITFAISTCMLLLGICTFFRTSDNQSTSEQCEVSPAMKVGEKI